MNQWVQQRGGYPNPVNPFTSLQPQALPLCSSAALSQAAGDGGGAPHPSWVLHPTLEPHIPRHPILPERPFSPAVPPHPNAPCPGHPIPPSFPYLGCIPTCCLRLFPGAGFFYSHPWLHLYRLPICFYYRQYSFTHNMWCALEQPVFGCKEFSFQKEVWQC